MEATEAAGNGAVHGAPGGNGGDITSTSDCVSDADEDGQNTVATVELYLTAGPGGRHGEAASCRQA